MRCFFLVKCSRAHGASLVAQSVKKLPAVQKTRVRSLGQEDPPEKEMATHSNILTWKILQTEKPGELQSVGVTRVGHDSATKSPAGLTAVSLALPGSGWHLQSY